MTGEEHAEAAARLADAARTRIPIAPLTQSLGDLSAQDAYAIQRYGIDARIAGGARLVGHKIGLTAVSVQQQLGVDSPDYGALLDDMLLPNGAAIPRDSLLAPRVEVEVAFILGAPLAGPGVTATDVQAATSYVAAAIEVVDSRIGDWRITLEDTVADNASSAALLLGPSVVPEGLDLAALGARLLRGGELVETGSTAAVLGDPRRAVAWLVNALGALGTTLEAGQIVLSGAATRMVDARSGDHFKAELDGLGSVSVSFMERPQ
jgi:2-keto-4-pentenoate hydratase